MALFAIDTEEKLNWFLNALENEEIQFEQKERTKEEMEELDREISEYKVMREKSNVSKELVFA
jgi:hypothetical protein